MKRAIVVIVVLAIGVAAVWYSTRAEAESTMEYRFVEVTRGNLESVVASTGSIGAVKTVQVGTQVSGIINQIYVDFNDPVRKGQIIARIDTTLLASSVRDAQANLRRAEAQFVFNKSEYDRIAELYEKQFTTEVALNQARFNLDNAQAGLETARIQLERQQRNLGYATIYSPINGVVVERNVDEGQTVAASLSAPQLFLIANDLSKLEILVNVDEADIGLIEQGQMARFTVQAYSDDIFRGVVRQVRLQSTVESNVVTYTVVVDVDNSDGRLLPGMTATVDFLVDRAEDVLMVPNAALRFRPTESMTAVLQQRFQALREQRQAAGDTTRAANGRNGGSAPSGGGFPGGAAPSGGGFPAGGGGFPGGAGSGGRNSNSAMLWYVDENNELQIARVRTGITDGSSTEITGRGLSDGMKIIAGVTEVVADGGFQNPFSSNDNAGGNRFSRGGGF
ncbi:MAG: efflux transporter periplasmic adaptor subunit [Bacteroidetes bacterium CG12_big_fil_rev_8_21_14_0_65_60_17]|nr:MAG: efflux transporter periplasmic adaptor subunit [Bacteroidetes bacterium CG12_big_fil_rev_8_21_14_0_65_60_17]